ncbi:MAG: ComEC/Rec2 family competence protein [Kiloniellales bacterium]
MVEGFETRAIAGLTPSIAATRRLRRGLGWLAETFAAERDRWALWIPVFFGAGIASYFALPVEPPLWVALAALAPPLLLLTIFRRPDGLLVAIAVIFVAAGFLTAELRSRLVAAPILVREIGPKRVVGEILEIDASEKRPRLLLQHIAIEGLDPADTPERVRIRLRRGVEGLAPGRRIDVLAVLRPPPEPVAPGAWDFARQIYFERIGGVGFSLGDPRDIEPPAEAGTTEWLLAWNLAWNGWRQTIAQRILTASPGQAGAVAAALISGDRSAITEDTLEAMRDSGLAHLLSISGLHFGIVAGLLFFALRAALALVPALALEWPIKKWAAVGALLGAFCYLFLVGVTAPTQRSFLMVAVVMLGVVVDRPPISPRLVAWAALVVLALAPESLLGPSFQMSFGAVVALVAGYEALAAHRPDIFATRGLVARVGLYVSGLAITSLIATVATAPFAIYHFNRMAWYGLAANMIAVPLTASWIMPWGLLALFLMPFDAESLALVPMGWGVELLLAVAHGVAGWPGAVSTVPLLSTAGLIAIALGGLWLCLWSRRWRLAGLVPVALGFASLLASTPPQILVSGNARLMAINPGDGLLWRSSGRIERFAAETWQRRLDLEETATWPSGGAALDGRLRCDSAGCVVSLDGRLVAFPRDPRALPEDCRLADVVISATPLFDLPCDKPQLVVDRFDLWRKGAHAIWLTPEGAVVETVAGERGARPWVVEPRARARN